MGTLIMAKPTIEETRKTGRIRKLITQLPIITGCKNAERLSVMFGAAYDSAYQNGTALDCTSEDLERPGHRLEILNPLNWGANDIRKLMIGWARLIIAEFRGYLEKGRITQDRFDEVHNAYKEEAMMADFEIDAIMTYEQAAAASFWWL